MVGSLEQFFSTELGKFDKIYMSHVFDHFYDPNESLEHTCDLLNDDGFLVIEVPNILKPYGSLDNYFLGYVYPSQLSPITLLRLLMNQSYSVLEMDICGSDCRNPQNIFILAGKSIPKIEHLNKKDLYYDVQERLNKYRSGWYRWGRFHWQFFTKLSRFIYKIGYQIKKILRGKGI